MDQSTIERAASQLRHAQESRTPCPPVRDLLPGAGVTEGYAVQEVNTVLALSAGRRLVGWKIGLTSKAVQEQLGVDQPDFGPLFADMAAYDDQPIALSQLLQAKVEGEVAFVLGGDLTDLPVTAGDVVAATDYVVPAIEIVASRIAEWDITIVDTIADNASSGMFVLGTNPTRLADVDLPAVKMTLTQAGTEVSSGTGAACLGNPVDAVVWLANTVAQAGRPLLAGHVVLSGALGPMVAVEPGATYEAAFDPLGVVRARFADVDGP
jgi:2-keto-4-pentenoate hydratase